MSKIFIQIASYRDPQLIPTIEDCLQHADNPDNLVFGLCRQFHPDDDFDNLDKYRGDVQIDKNYSAYMYANVKTDKAKRLLDYRVMAA